jgi:hypothetical protein
MRAPPWKSGASSAAQSALLECILGLLSGAHRHLRLYIDEPLNIAQKL